MTSLSFLDKCRTITDELILQPLNQYFTVPVDPKNDGLTDYFDKITQPMDFLTIQNKIKNKKYNNEYEWYKDVCLIYENAMKYHPSDSVFYKIAQYCSEQFKKKEFGLEYTESSVQEWYDAVCSEMQKFVKAVSQSPVPQGIDPFVITVLEKAKDVFQVSNSLIPDIVQKLNLLMKEEKRRAEIMYILRELQPSLELEGSDLEIKINSLSQPSLNAIYLYSRAF